MSYESEKTVTENLTLARYDLANFIAKHEGIFPETDLYYLKNNVLKRLNVVHQHLNFLNDKENDL